MQEGGSRPAKSSECLRQGHEIRKRDANDSTGSKGRRNGDVQEVGNRMQNLNLGSRPQHFSSIKSDSNGNPNSLEKLAPKPWTRTNNSNDKSGNRNFQDTPKTSYSGHNYEFKSNAGANLRPQNAQRFGPEFHKASTSANWKPKVDTQQNGNVNFRHSVNGMHNDQDSSQDQEEGWQYQRSKNTYFKNRVGKEDLKGQDNEKFSEQNNFPRSTDTSVHRNANINEKERINNQNKGQPIQKQQIKFSTKPSATESFTGRRESSNNNDSSANKDNVTIEPTQKVKKRRRRCGNKEERRAKRDETTLKELYKPKDSHVSLIDPEIFRKIKGEACSPKPSTSSYSYNSPGGEAESCASSGVADPSDFPSLDDPASSTTRRFKTFASISSSATPHVMIQPSPSNPAILDAPTVAISAIKPEREVKISCTPAPSWPKIGDLFPTSSKRSIQSTEANLPSTSTPMSASRTPKNVKLSRKPLIINLDALIESSKTKGSNILDKQIAKKKRKSDRSSVVKENYKLTKGNILDSSGPGLIHRGKIKIKAKKPTKLKKAILKSRELRKALTLTEFSLSDTDTVEHEPEIPKEETDTVKSASETETEFNSDKINDNVEDSSVLDSIIELKEGLPNISNSHRGTRIKEESKDSNVFKQILEIAEEAAITPTIPQAIVDLVKVQMHSRKFRQYCDMYTTKEFHHGLVVPLMKELHRLQDRLYKTDPMKFKIKRRYVNGLKDAASVLKLNKAQMIILAPDIEQNSGEGGLDERISEIISLAQEKNVPYIFSGNRFILGKCIMQTKSPVSAIAILDKQSTEIQFNEVVSEAEKLRSKYRSEFDQRVNEAMAKSK